MIQFKDAWTLLDISMMMLLFGFIISVLVDPYISRRHRNLLLAAGVMVFSLVIQNNMDYCLTNLGGSDLACIAVSVFGYVIRPVIIIMFIRIMNLQVKQWPFWLLAGINAAVYLTAFFSDISFTISNGSFRRGPLGYTCHIISVLLLLWLSFQTIKECRQNRRVESVLAIFCTFSVVISVLVDMAISTTTYVTYLTASVIIDCVVYYIWLHLKFVRDHEKSLLAEQRIQIMISQIQPHFLFNTISTIQALCMIDPEQAASTAERFGTYLRQNIESLNNTDLIPFSKELEHTQIYSDIEKIRFPALTVEYIIGDSAFRVPALTVQPLVENAIRHGVRGVKNGSVTVTTLFDHDCHVIEIRDNGKGFDTATIDSMGNTHIGLRNVRDRIRSMCGGEMDIESEENKGTVITIRIPAESVDKQ